MTPKELAAAIRKGHTMIGESHLLFLGSANCGCALGSAIVGEGHTKKEWDDFKIQYANFTHAAAELLGAKKSLCEEISHRHFSGQKRLIIADWLDSIPDETPLPPKVERESDEDYATRMLRQITNPREELLGNDYEAV